MALLLCYMTFSMEESHCLALQTCEHVRTLKNFMSLLNVGSIRTMQSVWKLRLRMPLAVSPCPLHIFTITSIVIGAWTGGLCTCGLIPARNETFSHLESIQTSCRTHTASYWLGTRGKVAGLGHDADHLRLSSDEASSVWRCSTLPP